MKVHYSGLEYWDYSLEELIRQLRTNSDQGLQSDELIADSSYTVRML